MKQDTRDALSQAFAPVLAAKARGEPLGQPQVERLVASMLSIDLTGENLDEFEIEADRLLATVEDEATIRVLQRGNDRWKPDPARIRRVVEFRRSLDQETDRGCVLMAAAFLDDELRIALEGYLVDPTVASRLLEGSGPLATFSARIDVAFSVGLLSRQAWRDLHLIRKIRNDFAHSAAPLSLGDAAPAARCRELFHVIEPVGLDARGRFCRAVLAVLALVEGGSLTSKRLRPMPDLPEERRAVDTTTLREKIAREIDGSGAPSPSLES